MFVMEWNPKENCFEEIEMEAYDRFPTKEEACMFTESGETFLYAHSSLFLQSRLELRELTTFMC
jgi:hypothetical protein